MIIKLFRRFKDNIVQITELLVLIVAFLFPHIIDVNGMFSLYIASNTIDPNNAVLYYILQCSNWIIGLACFFFVWWIPIRKYNRENVTMNRENVYHSYTYFWYWFSASILDIRRCNLKNVPLYMQIKLVVNDLFSEYPLDEKEYPETDGEVKIEKKNIRQGITPKEINVIIEDTYAIEHKQIPRSKSMLPTVSIYRERNGENSRHYSKKLVATVSSEIRNLPEDIIVNLFATLNPMNSLYISRGAFAMADRGNIKHLYVYQQSSKTGRRFDERRKKIY